MKNNGLNLKLFIFGSVFMVCWILGALRFQWDFISIIYGILNFPFGVLFLYLDNYSSSSLMNNEFVSVLIWGITVLCQGGIYYSLFKYTKAKWYEKSRKAN